MKVWKAWRLLGLGVCCSLLLALLASGVLAQPAGQYQVEGSTISGGGYRLTIANWQVSSTAAGGDYVLAVPYTPALRGSGCCCTYLPCIQRSW